MSNKTHYAAFLIRWQDDESQTRWRATVENAYTGQKRYFVKKSDLLRFLWQSLYEDDLSDLTGANTQEEV